MWKLNYHLQCKRR